MNLDLTPLASEYPFQPRRLPLDGGVSMSYVDEGAGPVLLFVHGNPTWSFAWRRLIRHFSPNFRCIAVDHIGCGLSDKPQHYRYVLDQHIENLRQLIESLDLNQITLIAHDWGGCIGMGTAVELPSRFSRFILMNTAAFRSRRIPLRIAACRLPLVGPLAVRGLNLFSRAALQMAVSDTRNLTPAARAGYLAPYNSWQNRIAIQRFVEDIPMQPRHPSYDRLVRIEDGLARLTDRPLLLPWGEQDWCFTPEFRREFERRFPRAESAPFPEAGHYLFEDAPDALIARIETFLSTRSGQAT